jgi:heat shock protein HtpX
VALQGIAGLYSDRLLLRAGPVLPSAERPRVTVISVRLPRGPDGRFVGVPRARVAAVRPRLQALLAGSSGVPDRGAVGRLLNDAGIPCDADGVSITERDVHASVERVARRFHLPMPKIVVSETGVSNAAATGASPRHATVLVTAGSLEELDDARLEAVLAHELGHVRGRDAPVLIASTAILYLGALFVWPSVLFALGLAYFVLVFVAIYAIGKVLETRADTQAASDPEEARDLSLALTSIAFREYFSERRSRGFRVLRWLSLDTHPPVYFRIQRLIRLEGEPLPVRHPLRRSARDCLEGFGRALIGRE